MTVKNQRNGQSDSGEEKYNKKLRIFEETEIKMNDK